MKVFLEFPLLKREFVGLLRTRRAFWLTLFLVALASLLPLLTWPTGTAGLSSQNREVFLIFAMTQLIAALLIIPAFTAGAISGERERGTFEMLYTTLLSPWSIIFSKVSASVGYVVMVMIATAPSLCVLLLIGGLRYESIAVCYAVTFLSVVSSGVVCLAVSLRSKTTAQSVVRGFIWTIFWNGGLALAIYLGTLVVFLILGMDYNRQPPVWMYFLVGMSPFPILTMEVFSSATGPFPTALSLPWIYTIYVASFTLLHLVFLLRRIRMPDLARPATRRWFRKWRAQRTGPPKRTWFSRCLLRLGDSRRHFLGNPVFRKEVCAEFFGRPGYRRVLFWAPLVIFLLVTWGIVELPGSPGPEMPFLWVGNVTLALMLVLLPAVSASSIPREIEQGNIDLLRGTLVSLWRVLNGKYLAGIFSVWGLYCAAFLSLIPISLWFLSRNWGYFDMVSWGGFVTVYVLIVTLLFCVSLANFFSAVSKKTVAALLLTYIALIGILIGIPIFAQILRYRSLRVFVEETHPFGVFTQSITDFNGYFRGDFGDNLGRLAIFTFVYLGGAIALWAAAGALLTKLRSRD